MTEDNEKQEKATLDTVVKELKNINGNMRVIVNDLQLVAIIGGIILFQQTCDYHCTPKDAKADTLNESTYVMQAGQNAESAAPKCRYNIDGQRVYLEIDGQPVAEYLKGRQ